MIAARFGGLALAVLGPAARALSCPFCAQGGPDRYGSGFSWLVLMMIALPFTLLGLGLRQVLIAEKSSTSLATPQNRELR